MIAVAGNHPEHPLCTATTAGSSRSPAAPNGGSACVIHSLCSPVGGRPASPQKSQSKSQRGQTSGDTQLRQATVKPGQVLSEPSPATPSDAREVTGGQGVAGSNPAVPTGQRLGLGMVIAPVINTGTFSVAPRTRESHPRPSPSARCSAARSAPRC